MWNKIKGFFSEIAKRVWNACKSAFKGVAGGVSVALSAVPSTLAVLVAVPAMFVANDGLTALPLGLLAGILAGLTALALAAVIAVVSPLVGLYDASAWLILGEGSSVSKAGDIFDDLTKALEDATAGVQSMRRGEAGATAMA